MAGKKDLFAAHRKTMGKPLSVGTKIGLRATASEYRSSARATAASSATASYVTKPPNAVKKGHTEAPRMGIGDYNPKPGSSIHKRRVEQLNKSVSKK